MRLRKKIQPVRYYCVGVKNYNSKYFDAKLRLALQASLRSAIFREIKVANKLFSFPAGLNGIRL
jgi:hypothetical protein